MMDFKKFFKDKKNVALTILSVLLIGSFSAQGTKNHELTQAEAKIEQLNQEIDNTKSDLIDSQDELSDFKEENAKYIELGKKEYQKVKAIEDEAEAAVTKLENNQTQENLDAATKKVNAVSDSKVKEKFNVELKDHHRAMGDTMGLALAYPKLKKLYVQKYDWESKQLENVEYLFERFLRLQQTVTTLQSEMQDLKSVFKLYFEQGGVPITSQEGDMLVYNSKQSFGYDFNAIKPVLEEVGALEKAVKINTGFVDRLVNGRSLDDEKKEIIKNARQELTETRNIQVIKNNK